MEENNNVELPKKKSNKVAIIIACIFGGGFLLVMLLPLLFNIFVYGNVKKRIEDQTKKAYENEVDSYCAGYKTFTKYESDNDYFYNQCVKGEIDPYSSSIKVVYDNDDMDLGFYQTNDSETYIPRDGHVSKNYATKIITNEDGNDLVTFGRLYAEASGNYAKNFLWIYTDTFDSNTCVSKEFLEILSNQIYGKDGVFVKELFKDDDPNHGDNMYCLGTYGFGPGENFEYVSKEESDTEVTIKYKNVSGWDDMTGKAYATISFKIEDGFWIITDYTLGDN